MGRSKGRLITLNFNVYIVLGWFQVLLHAINNEQFYKHTNHTILNPLIIVEVLSESTQNYDRGAKFVAYRTLPSLKEYVLIDQYKIYVEHFSKREDNKWVLTELTGKVDLLDIPRINFQIPLQEIYSRVEFTED